MRENKYKTQVIFLTSYAEFDYARHAIAMNSVDYLLKPIDYGKLDEAVCKAAGKVMQERRSEDDRSESRLWRQNQEKEAELISPIEVYLEELEERELITRDILRIFQMDIMQMVYSWLEKKEIKAHLLFAGKESEDALKLIDNKKENRRKS